MGNLVDLVDDWSGPTADVDLDVIEWSKLEFQHLEWISSRRNGESAENLPGQGSAKQEVDRVTVTSHRKLISTKKSSW